LTVSTLCPRISLHLIGHGTITQTMDAYSHVMAEMGNIAASAFEEAWS
jgi:hypothetical protein